MTDTTAHRITSLAELDALYGAANPLAIAKEAPRLTEPYRRFVELAPFVAIATQGAGGLDCTPRGDPGAVAVVLDDKTVAIPDRRGNNRLDTLSNIIANPAVGLMFMIPGVNEVLRVNGSAELRIDAELTSRFLVQGRAPKLVILVHVAEAYLHCPKALMRSSLWDSDRHVERSVLPSLSEMLRDQIAPGETFEAPESAIARYKTQLY